MAKKPLTSAQISANAAKKTWTQPALMKLGSAYFDASGKIAPGIPTPPPFDPNSDPNYVNTVAGNNQGYSDLSAQTGISFDANGNPVYSGGAYLSEAQATGFDENGNPITDPSDPRYNPFSQAKLMRQAFENRKAYTSDNYANAGQGNSGALLHAQGVDATNYATNYNAASRGAKDYYQGLVNQTRQGRDTTTINNNIAKGTALTDYTNAHAKDPAPMLKPNLGGATPKVNTGAPKSPLRRTLTLGGRIANRSGFVKPQIRGPIG